MSNFFNKLIELSRFPEIPFINVNSELLFGISGFMLLMTYFLLFFFFFPSISSAYVKNKQMSFLFHASLFMFIIISLYTIIIDKLQTRELAYLMLFVFFFTISIGYFIYINSFDINSQILRNIALQKSVIKLIENYRVKNEERLPISKCMNFHDGSYYLETADDVTPECKILDNGKLNCSDDGSKITDFYIASSNQSCLLSKINGNFVSEEILRAAIVGGARFLDLDVYTHINQKGAFPVVRSEYGLKKSLNYVELENCFSVVAEEAFRMSSKNDPLFIHLNLKTYNIETFDRIADLIIKIFPKEYLLDPKYNYKTKNESFDLNNVPICELFNKIIIIVSGNCEYTQLDQLINLHTNHNAQKLDYKEAKSPADHDKFVLDTKLKFTIVVPNNFSSNPEPDKCWKFGCQCVLMNYINLGNIMNLHDNFFKNSNLIMKKKYLQRSREEAGRVQEASLPI